MNSIDKPCQLCETPGGHYDFKNDCCMLRYLSQDVMTKEQRRGWIERWEDQLGTERIAPIRDALRNLWKQKKQEALSYGRRK